jgi:catalase
MKLSKSLVRIPVRYDDICIFFLKVSLELFPDFHRKDLEEAITNGCFPKWTFAIQTIEEKDEHKFDFDILDATKIWPEELVPLERIGELVLNRTVDEFFPEVEQVAFCTSHVVPGIGFSDDPLLQGRNFSYFDTQITRLGINWEQVSKLAHRILSLKSSL